MTAFVFFIFKSTGEGEGWFEGDSTLLIHYKKLTKNTGRFNLLIQKYHGKLLQICTDEIPGEY
jgi:hypothetical protein